MSRRINKRNFVAGFDRNLISADMLGNAAGLMRRHVGFAQSIQQRSLTVVNVSHNRYHRRSRLHLFRPVFFAFKAKFDIAVGNAFDAVSHFFDDNLRRIAVNRLVNCCHHTQSHKFFNNVGTFFGHVVCQFLNGNNFGNNYVLNDFLLRLLRLNRFRLFLLEAAPGTAETIIVVIVVNRTDAVQIDLAAAALRFETALHDFLAFLFESLFTAQRLLCHYRFLKLLTVIVVFIVLFVIVIIFGLFNFELIFGSRLFFSFRLNRHGSFRGFALSFLLLAFQAFLFFKFSLAGTFLFAFLLFLTAAGFVLLGFGNQLKLLRRHFVDLNLRLGSSSRIDYSFLANFDLHEFFAVMAVRPGSVADILKCKCRFAR